MQRAVSGRCELSDRITIVADQLIRDRELLAEPNNPIGLGYSKMMQR